MKERYWSIGITNKKNKNEKKEKNKRVRRNRIGATKIVKT